MSMEDIAKVGCRTERVAATATVTAKTIPAQSKNVIVNNAGSSPVFVTTGAATGITHVYPTTATGQNGSIVLSSQTQTFKKNNPTDNTIYLICDTGGTADVLISFVDGE